MKKQLTRIDPFKAGIFLAVSYGIICLISFPILILATILGTPGPSMSGIGLLIIFAVLYAIGGFFVGIIAACIYNLVAKLTGGLEFEFRDVPPAP